MFERSYKTDFPKDLLSDYLETTTAVVVPYGGPKKCPGTSI